MRNTLVRLTGCVVGLATVCTALMGADSSTRTSKISPAGFLVGTFAVATEITFFPGTIVPDGSLGPTVVNVAPGTNVRFVLGGIDPSTIRSVVWSKNGKPLATTAQSVEFYPVSVADSGIYSVVINTGAVTSPWDEGLILRVEPPGRQRMLNLSSRVTINPAQRTVISGFVIAASAGDLGEKKVVLVRAVGPSLGSYGVADPLADPVLRVVRQDGTELTPSPAYATPAIADLVAARVGAFPLPRGTKDVAAIYELPAGIYSAQVSSASAGTGSALVEIYEVPQ